MTSFSGKSDAAALNFSSDLCGQIVAVCNKVQSYLFQNFVHSLVLPFKKGVLAGYGYLSARRKMSCDWNSKFLIKARLAGIEFRGVLSFTNSFFMASAPMLLINRCPLFGLYFTSTPNLLTSSIAASVSLHDV